MSAIHFAIFLCSVPVSIAHFVPFNRLGYPNNPLYGVKTQESSVRIPLIYSLLGVSVGTTISVEQLGTCHRTFASLVQKVKKKGTAQLQPIQLRRSIKSTSKHFSSFSTLDVSLETGSSSNFLLQPNRWQHTDTDQPYVLKRNSSVFTPCPS